MKKYYLSLILLTILFNGCAQKSPIPSDENFSILLFIHQGKMKLDKFFFLNILLMILTKTRNSIPLH